MRVEFERSETRAFLLFALFGLLTATVYFGTLAILLEVVHVEYRWAVSVSYLTGVLFNFSTNRVITFKHRELSGIHRQILKYSILVAINYLLTILIVIFTVETLCLLPYIGVVFSMGATLITGYILSRFWVFKRAS